jgi:hypothetical protein
MKPTIAKIHAKLKAIIDVAVRRLDEMRTQAEEELRKVRGDRSRLHEKYRKWISNAPRVKRAIKKLEFCLEVDATADLEESVENLKGAIRGLSLADDLRGEVGALQQALATFDPRTGFWNLP